MQEKLLEAITLESEKYDEMPYESYPFQFTHPSYLRTIGTIFGLKVTEINKAKILELGCASGNNIIPVAYNYPKSKITGIDLSAVQINDGLAQIEALGLKNIELKVASIMDVDESWGKFDYIICHGVYSWVPEEVRNKILDISKNNLSPNGIAIISYNTLPGWNMANTARQLMLYHVKNFDDISAQVQQSKLILSFAKESASGMQDYYSKMFDQEISIVQSAGDSYLRHEYLGEFNSAFYFHEFMKEARKRELHYLADAHISSMFLGNFPPEISEKLKVIGDIVKTEQYLDFITNRRFRCTMLCHDNQKIDRGLNEESFKDVYMFMNIKLTDDFKEEDINSDKPLKVIINNNPQNEISTVSTIMKAALYNICMNPFKEYRIEELINLVAKKLAHQDKEAIHTELAQNFIRLILSGFITINIDAPQYVTIVSDKPKISDFALYLIKQNSKLWTTNQRHEKVELNLIEKLVLQYLDGSNSLKNIETKLFKLHQEKIFNIKLNNIEITEDKEVKLELKKYIENTIERISKSKMLIA